MNYERIKTYAKRAIVGAALLAVTSLYAQGTATKKKVNTVYKDGKDIALVVPGNEIKPARMAGTLNGTYVKFSRSGKATNTGKNKSAVNIPFINGAYTQAQEDMNVTGTKAVDALLEPGDTVYTTIKNGKAVRVSETRSAPLQKSQKQEYAGTRQEAEKMASSTVVDSAKGTDSLESLVIDSAFAAKETKRHVKVNAGRVKVAKKIGGQHKIGKTQIANMKNTDCQGIYNNLTKIRGVDESNYFGVDKTKGTCKVIDEKGLIVKGNKGRKMYGSFEAMGFDGKTIDRILNIQ